MKFLVDESADARLVIHLRALGHDATAVAADHRPGLPDAEVLALARREGRTLITDDTDFGDLVVRHRQPHTGVMLFRLNTTVLAARIERLDYVLGAYAAQLDQLLVSPRERVRVAKPLLD